MTTRLSKMSLTGTERTLVAVGTDKLSSILEAVRARLRASADNRRRLPGAFQYRRTWLAGRPGPVRRRPVWPRRPAIEPVLTGPVLTGLVLIGPAPLGPAGSALADRAGVRSSAPAHRRRSGERA